MKQYRSAGKILGIVLAIIAGALLLARNFGYATLWSGLSRYWSLLIIAWGAVKLLDYHHRKRTGKAGSLFSSGEIALLFLFILAGSALTVAVNISPNFRVFLDLPGLDIWDVTGNNHQFDEHHEADVPTGSIIEISNMFGNVNVRPSDSGRVVLDVEKTVRASSREDAERLSKDFTFLITNEGSKYRIFSNQDKPLKERRRFKSSLRIQVPKQSMLELHNRNGKVSLRDLTGDQVVFNQYGAVDAERINGGIHVESSFQNTNVRDVKGPVTVKSRYGDVEVAWTSPPEDAVSVFHQFGNVTLRLPAMSSFLIDAHTDFGSIDSDFAINGASSRGGQSLTGQIGESGPHIRIESRYGDVHLEKR